ncbi:MAG: nickel insertion protein [Christensenellaceae bacterium]
MKTLYLDCGMGAAGDMLAGALYDLLSEEQRAEFQNIAAAFSAVGLNVMRCRRNAALRNSFCR